MNRTKTISVTIGALLAASPILANCNENGGTKTSAASLDASADARSEGSVDDAAANAHDSSIDAAADASSCGDAPCPLRPSICVDEETMEIYVPFCGDSGTCEVEAHRVHCEPAGLSPACAQGGCSVVVLR